VWCKLSREDATAPPPRAAYSGTERTNRGSSVSARNGSYRTLGSVRVSLGAGLDSILAYGSNQEISGWCRALIPGGTPQTVELALRADRAARSRFVDLPSDPQPGPPRRCARLTQMPLRVLREPIARGNVLELGCVILKDGERQPCARRRFATHGQREPRLTLCPAYPLAPRPCPHRSRQRFAIRDAQNLPSSSARAFHVHAQPARCTGAGTRRAQLYIYEPGADNVPASGSARHGRILSVLGQPREHHVVPDNGVRPRG
jgi:hypothetical protein